MTKQSIIEKRYNYKKYAYGTLKSMTKDELIRHIRRLENDWNNAEIAMEGQRRMLDIAFDLLTKNNGIKTEEIAENG